MSLVYSYSGIPADSSGPLRKKTNYSQPVTLFITGTTVASAAVKISIKNHLDAFEPIDNLEFGEGFHEFRLPTGIQFQIDVDNGGVNGITVDVYT